MCGFVGLINWGDTETLKRATHLQAHRGPDDHGIWTRQAEQGPWVGLGSRRLSILDISAAGHMPMASDDGLVTVVYNGEIYNYPQLRQQLEAQGHQFRSHSDTEVLLHLYRRYGPEFVARLNGMFAFALWDESEQRLLLARDHLGIKPLYYAHQEGRLACASELKSLLELPDLDRRICREGLSQYLSFLWVPESETILGSVKKLPPGHLAVLQNGRLKVSRYWDLSYPPRRAWGRTDPAELALELRHRFSATVKSQMLSDVPVGAFLSAGLDSSSIVAMMAEHSSEPVRTFTIAFPKEYHGSNISIDDVDVARRTAERFGCSHTELIVEPEVIDLLPKLVWHMDEPVADPAIITAFLVCQEARKSVTVLLSGTGGDEVFAGYRKYQAHYLVGALSFIPVWLRAALSRLAQRLPTFTGNRLALVVRLLKKLLRSAHLPPTERFVGDSLYFNESQKRALCGPSYLNGAFDARHTHLDHFRAVDGADFLNQMSYVDLKTFLPSLNLNYNDKMAMAASVESRVPFLDWEFLEWTAHHIPPSLKLKGLTTKHILRESMRGVLADEVLAQKKAGFGAPVDVWLKRDLAEYTRDLLSPERIRARGLFDPDTVARMFREYNEGKFDWSYQIWQLLTLEIWFDQFKIQT